MRVSRRHLRLEEPANREASGEASGEKHWSSLAPEKEANAIQIREGRNQEADLAEFAALVNDPHLRLAPNFHLLRFTVAGQQTLRTWSTEAAAREMRLWGKRSSVRPDRATSATVWRML
jgi:hypothetical protein